MSTNSIHRNGSNVKADPHSFEVREQKYGRYRDERGHTQETWWVETRPATEAEINLRRVRTNKKLLQRLVPDLMEQFYALDDETDTLKEEVVWARHFPIGSDWTVGDKLERATDKLNLLASKIVRILDRHLRRLERQEESGVDLDEITEDVPEPIEGLPFDIYPQSIVLMYGLSQQRKSYLALHLAARMAEKGQNVVIYQNEGSKANTAARLKAWQAEYTDSLTKRNKTLKLLDTDNIELNLSDDESVDNFIEEMQPYEPSMIVIDALTGAYEGEENSNSDLRIVFENVRYIKDELNTIVVLIDNTGKDKTRGARGAQVKFDKSDTVISVETKDIYTYARYEKQRFGEKRGLVSFYWTEHAIQQGSKTYTQIAPVTNTTPDIAALILAHLDDSETATFSELKRVTGSHDQTLTRTLNAMVAEGQIVKQGRKYLKPTPDNA